MEVFEASVVSEGYMGSVGALTFDRKPDIVLSRRQIVPLPCLCTFSELGDGRRKKHPIPHISEIQHLRALL